MGAKVNIKKQVQTESCQSKAGVISGLTIISVNEMMETGTR